MYLLILTLKVLALKNNTFKVKINTFKIRIEKCPENKKLLKLLYTQIVSIQIDRLIIRPSITRPTEKTILSFEHKQQQKKNTNKDSIFSGMENNE